MYKKLFIAAPILLFSVFQSCAPVYKCGDPKPEAPISGGNRLLAVVEERDELCEEVERKEEENLALHEKNETLTEMNDSLTTRNRELVGEYAELEREHEELKEKHEALNTKFTELGERYSKMMSDNFQRGYHYEEQLKNREAKLNKKEEELIKRQRKIEELETLIKEQEAQAKKLNELLREALLGFKSDELTVQIKEGKVHILMSNNLMFKSGSTSVETKGKDALEILARVIKENEGFDVLIEGHTDNVPISTAKFKDNWDLSVARATSIVRVLTGEYEVTPQRLTASGKGEFKPRASNENAEGRAENRRTEIILYPKLDKIMDIIGE